VRQQQESAQVEMIVGVVDNILNVISSVWLRVFGKHKLMHYEVICLNSMGRELTKESQKNLFSQLNKFNLVQRPAYGLKSIFYDVKDPKYLTWGDEDLFHNREENLKVFSGILRGQEEDIEAKIKFEIFIHRGRLSSIEFQSEPKIMEKLNQLEVINSKMLSNI
jgi:hypothetical protein